MKISDLERLSGVSRSTIHYYMREGLLTPARRTGATMAYYDKRNLDELRRIRKLKEEGYPLSFIRDIIRGERKPARSGGAGDNETPSERRRQIMDAAVEMFARKGYHETNVTDISREVGVGHSTFYIYFPSKRALFMECVDQVFQAMFSDVWEEIRHEEDPLRRLRKRGEVVLKSHPQFIDILNVLRNMVEDDPRLEAKRKEIYASIVEPVKRDLTRAMERRMIPRVDPELAGYFVMGFLETAATLMSLDDRYTVDELLDQIEGMTFPASPKRAK
jgi:AcrR family transcriptional regulator